MGFRQLHQQNTPLIIANVWDVASARVASKLGFSAIGTSSAAIASTLGYEDGQQMSFDELTLIVKRIIASVQLPLSVDLEYGYGSNPAEIAHNIASLAKLGVIGINLEDSYFDGVRMLKDSGTFDQELADIIKKLKMEGVDVFINVRTDAYLLNVDDKLAATKDRITTYERAGADGIFVPCVEDENDILALVKSTSLPVNVMCMPDLPDFNRLQALGVKRVSMGNFLFEYMMKSLEKTTREVQQNQSFKTLF